MGEAFSPDDSSPRRSVAVIGGGPAGLMAAEVLAQAGAQVDLYDAMPSVGRKLLVAGKGGLNLTHSEEREQFFARYGARRAWLEPYLDAFGPDDLRRWARELGIETFVGTSGRVFPVGMRAWPLLRAWLLRLRQAGVVLHVRHAWRGWSEDGALRFETPQGGQLARAQAVVLALGGGSWPRLGSDGKWTALLLERGVEVAPLRPSNCGFDVGWTAHFRERFAGQPVKPVVLSFTDSRGGAFCQQGEFVVTANGVEGSLIYAVSARLRDEIEAQGRAVIELDLAPGWPRQRLADRLSQPRGARSAASHLRHAVGLQGVKAGLLWEFVPRQDWADPARLAGAIKTLPIPLIAPRPLEEAISSAGGVACEALDERLMLRAMPGVFCAGEMLDWEAPTGGYMITACCATGRAAGRGALAWLEAAKQRETRL